MTYLNAEQYDEGTPLMRSVVAACRGTFGDQHPVTVRDLAILARAELNLNNTAAARSHADEVFASRATRPLIKAVTAVLRDVYQALDQQTPDEELKRRVHELSAEPENGR